MFRWICGPQVELMYSFMDNMGHTQGVFGEVASTSSRCDAAALMWYPKFLYSYMETLPIAIQGGWSSKSRESGQE